MNLCHSISRLMIIPLGIAVSMHAFADWKFDSSKSDLSATFTDQRSSGDVNHVYHVEHLQGDIDSQGHLEVPLELTQLDLMKQLPQFVSAMIGSQSAEITGTIDPTWFNVPVGKSITKPVPLTFTSHHHSNTQSVDLKMTHTGADTYQVTTAKPMSIHSSELMKQSYSGLILSALGYQKLGDNVPINLNAQLTKN